MAKITVAKLHKAASKIELLILDVDGVMTNGSIMLDNNGNEYKAFNVRDGHGIKMLQRAGVKVAIITGRMSKVVDRRAAELGITEVHQGSKDKLLVFNDLISRLGIGPENIAYVGDDIVDLPVMLRVGLSIAVADAEAETKKRAMWATKARAGSGAVREVADMLLKARGAWGGAIEKYIKI